MAIEFNCPYCTSAIRVKDAAAGKRGRCPRCNEQLLVPEVRPPVSPSPADVAPVAKEPVVAPTIEPAAVQPPNQPSLPTPNLDAPPVVTTPTPHSAPRRVKRRRRTNMTLAMTILGLCFAAIIGLAGYLWWSNKPLVLEGTLDGEYVPNSVLTPTVIPAGDIDVSAEKRNQVLTSLAELPYRLKSSLLVTELSRAGEEFEVKLLPTPDTVIVRVSPTLNENLKQWLEENAGRLQSKRATDLKEASTKFFNDYDPLASMKLPRGDQAYYRNRLALAASNSGLGYLVEARAGSQLCPSIFEDSVGNLHFAVPRNTLTLQILGRTIDGVKLFPGTFTVQCYAPEEVQVAEPPLEPAKDSDKAGDEKTEPMDEKQPAGEPNMDEGA